MTYSVCHVGTEGVNYMLIVTEFNKTASKCDLSGLQISKV